MPNREKVDGVTVVKETTEVYGSEGSKFGGIGLPGTCVCFDGWKGSNCGKSDVSIFQSTLCPAPAGMQYAYLKLSNNYKDTLSSADEIAKYDTYEAADFRGAAGNDLMG